jgi:hypothetical protein
MKKYLLALGCACVIIAITWFIALKPQTTDIGNVNNIHASSSDVIKPSAQPLKTLSGYSLLIGRDSVSLTSLDAKVHSCSVNKETRFFTRSSGTVPRVGDILVATYDASLSQVKVMVLSRNTDMNAFRIVHPEKNIPLNIVVGVIDSVKEGVVAVNTENGKVVNVAYDNNASVVLDNWLIDTPVQQNLRAEINCIGEDNPIAQTVVLYK